jgi:hypothetical protein
MRVMEMKELPKRVGDAEIHLAPGNAFAWEAPAFRKEKEIILSEEGSPRFYQLKNGEQFLYTSEDRGGNRHLYFGGMDESPFLVELEMRALEHAIEGERAFFEGLKPSWIRQVEQKMKRRTKRQGDFFAFSVSKNMVAFINEYVRHGTRVQMDTAEKSPVEGTRHRFSGLRYFILNRDGHVQFSGGEGLLEAPDHAPLKLDGPHIIMQALHLVRPKEAD